MSFLSLLFENKNPLYEHIKLIDPHTFKKHIRNKKAKLIDVRTPAEFNQGHIKKAININLYSGSFIIEFDKLKKDQAVYLYCRTGRRSRTASRKLAKRGFTKIYDLQGGIMNWS